MEMKQDRTNIYSFVQVGTQEAAAAGAASPPPNCSEEEKLKEFVLCCHILKADFQSTEIFF